MDIVIRSMIAGAVRAAWLRSWRPRCDLLQRVRTGGAARSHGRRTRSAPGEGPRAG